MLKKGMIIGVIFLLMLVSIPMVSGEDILYPKEEGPYNVLIFGGCPGMGGGFYTCLLHFWPLWFLIYPLQIMWHFNPDSVFFVNGETQDIIYPATIWLEGFKGYGTSIHMTIVKQYGLAFFYPLTGFMPISKARVIGRCTEIVVSDAR